MATMVTPSSPAAPPTRPTLPVPSQTFDFQRLLPELRTLVWEAALPGPRVFQVRRTFGPWNGWAPEGGTDFHITHPRPALLGVCHESRAVALRKGIYLSRNLSWFNPETDILYFDKNDKNHCLPRITGRKPPLPVLNWDKVLNVGVEWRAFFHKTPRPQSTREMRAMWRAVIRLLQMYLPGMRRLHYVLPMVRHRGGLTWGREPYGSRSFQAELVVLPGTTNVPWGDALILNTAPQLPAGAARTMAELLDLRKDQLIPWDELKRDIQLALDECDADKMDDEDADWMAGVEKQKDLPMPEIVGRWLVRPSAHYDEEVQMFVT